MDSIRDYFDISEKESIITTDVVDKLYDLMILRDEIKQALDKAIKYRPRLAELLEQYLSDINSMIDEIKSDMKDVGII